MANSNFYDNLDLRYPEIAICIDRIDRINPGIKNFYIPILTPNVDTSSLKTKTEIVRLDNSILENDQKINISSVKVQNYIPISIPKELCSILDGEFSIENIKDISIKTNNGKINITGSTQSGGTMTFDGKVATFKGDIKIIPKNRYIDAGSKWIVVFIGGDINKPQIIGRYTE